MIELVRVGATVLLKMSIFLPYQMLIADQEGEVSAWFFEIDPLAPRVWNNFRDRSIFCPAKHNFACIDRIKLQILVFVVSNKLFRYG